jgi:hypothetical protein
LYFTSLTKAGHVGSSDIEETVERLKLSLRDLKKVPQQDVQAIWDKNVAIARAHFLRILYARMFILRVFLSLGPDIDQFSNLWFLLQVAPRTFLDVDIFARFVHQLSGTSYEFLETALSKEMRSVGMLVGDASFCDKLFCVIDESQYLADAFPGFFRSVKDSTQD